MKTPLNTLRRPDQDRGLLALAVSSLFFLLAAGKVDAQQTTGSTRELTGSVQVAGQPLAGATVTLYAAGAAAPAKVSEAKTDDQGAFKLGARHAPSDSVLYVVAKGPSEGAALLSVLGATLPATITVNELTTVASAFAARNSSMGNRFLVIRSDCGSLPETYLT